MHSPPPRAIPSKTTNLPLSLTPVSSQSPVWTGAGTHSQSQSVSFDSPYVSQETLDMLAQNPWPVHVHVRSPSQLVPGATPPYASPFVSSGGVYSPHTPRSSNIASTQPYISPSPSPWHDTIEDSSMDVGSDYYITPTQPYVSPSSIVRLSPGDSPTQIMSSGEWRTPPSPVKTMGQIRPLVTGPRGFVGRPTYKYVKPSYGGFKAVSRWKRPIGPKYIHYIPWKFLTVDQKMRVLARRKNNFYGPPDMVAAYHKEINHEMALVLRRQDSPYNEYDGKLKLIRRSEAFRK